MTMLERFALVSNKFVTINYAQKGYFLTRLKQ